ncbi:MAG: type I methionyl aminopeptidase [Candidatus Eisenbacteria bacterium]|nr:type I methionyl aminopeptidase [Candidatus Eisenbacteria bacterium]
MIYLRRQDEIEKIRESGSIVAGALDMVETLVGPGVTTMELDAAIEEFIRSHDGTPSFKGYHGYPASSCLSVNEVVVHGIPAEEIILREGDVIGVAIGCYKNGYHGDAARSFAVGDVDDEVYRQMLVTREALREAIRHARDGNRVGDISHAVQAHVEGNGFSVVRDMVGHGVGAKLHEDPQVPNFGPSNRGPRLKEGMVLALEPMVNAGVFDVRTMADGWTVVTKDGRLSTHFEHTVAVTAGEPLVLTLSPRFQSVDEEVEGARAERGTRTG